MRLKVLSLFAAVLLVAACGSNQEELATTAGDGGAQSGVESTVTPGTEEDFVVNVGDRVFYALNQSDLSPEARATLDRQAQWLQQYPNVSVTIEGHADERGTREYNLALGERRANGVKNYLVAAGVPAERITTVSYGKERPAVLGSNESAWAQNRRSVTTIN
ncbi:MAG TPA: peptidoglycan-associated lipoprotein Pal [Alphaproteobacteria bacterium]|nr:peptidoglycan-associated lipoprotein Pal [Alphaproteobacteria bacterium]